jgi:hypothetical protein
VLRYRLHGAGDAMSLEAMKMALEAMELEVKGYSDKHSRLYPSIQSLRQAIEQAEKQEPMVFVPGFYCGEKISLSRIKLGEKFVLVRTGQIYSKTRDGYWSESEQRPARLHLNCQVQLIKEKNT